jgi:hypothetical protein
MCPGITVPARELPMNRIRKLGRAKVAALPVHSSRSDNREGQSRSILLSDAERIADGCIIGASSIVTKLRDCE